MLLEYGHETFPYKQPDGSISNYPLINGCPRILYKSVEEPICITFSFFCPIPSCICKIPEDRRATREAGKSYCPYSRKIRFLDSCLHIPSSLNSMIDSLNEARLKEKLSLRDAFKSTYRYAKSQGFSEEQFEHLCLSKMPMPYEFPKNLSCLFSTVPLKKEDFKSILRGTKGLTDLEMKEFTDTWDLLNIKNLFHLYQIYNCCDVTLQADTTVFFMTKLFIIPYFR